MAEPSKPSREDAGAKLLASWLGYAWEGLTEARASERPSGSYPIFCHTQFGWQFQGGKQDLRDLAESILAAFQPDPGADDVERAREVVWEIDNGWLSDFQGAKNSSDAEDRRSARSLRLITSALRLAEQRVREMAAEIVQETIDSFNGTADECVVIKGWKEDGPAVKELHAQIAALKEALREIRARGGSNG